MGYAGKAKWIARPAASVALRYGLALVSVAAALGLAHAFLYFRLPQPFTAFALSAIAITFWYGGTKPGILAALLSAIVRTYFFEPETDTISRALYDLVFLVFALLMTRVTRARNELEARVVERTAELTRANEDLTLQIIERKRTEDALRQSEMYLAEAQRMGRTGSFGWSVAAGEIVWSEEIFRIFECDRAMKPTLELVLQRTHPDDRTLVRRFIERVSHDGEDWDLEHRLLMPDGSVKHVRAVAHAVKHASSNLAFVGAVTDITAARRAEDELHQARAELAHVARVTTVGELTAAIAHEVKQPLTAIVTNGEACLRWLDRDVPELDEARQAVTRMISEGKRADEVIQRIRAMLRKDDSRKAPLDLNDVINEAVPLIRRELSKHRVVLKLELEPGLPPTNGDRIQLQQVIINLLVNGIQAMAEISDRPRELLVETRRDEDNRLLVRVQDSGVGIDPEHMHHLFNSFFTTKTNGMGMGLSICRSIIEAHGGRIWASANVGPGATFQFSLPVGVVAVG